MTDEQYMRRAIELAKRGMGYTSPNPMVGAVIVKDGRIIGEGWHERYGELHAERNALKHCKESPRGADMYVTLEPCCHHGKQPPCVEAVIEAGIKRVYVGSDDPNPLVAGGGIKILKEHGIEVVTQVLKDECDRLNEVFFYFIQTRRPYVAMKYAMTMDGKIATYSGLSKWITGEKAREHVQNLRHRYKAIMAGIGTVLADDPLLTCRIEGGVNPIRIICDTHLKLPLESQIVNTAKEVPTIVAVSERYRETAQSEALSETEIDSIEKNNNYLEELSKKVDKISERKYVESKLKGMNGFLTSSLRYIWLLSLTPLRGILPGIGARTVATRKLLHNMLKNMHYEKQEKIIYSLGNYESEINNKIYDIDSLNYNIDLALEDVQKLKKEFKDYFLSYSFKEYDKAYKKIELIEKNIIDNKNKVYLIKEKLIKSKELNRNTLTKVKKLNDKN